MTPPSGTEQNNCNHNHHDEPQESLEQKHARLCKTITSFDQVDIGQRVPELPSDLQDIKSILITGGAGFM